MTVDVPLSLAMTSLTDPCMAEVLSDLNLFYIRQIGASLKKHVGLQDRLEREMKIRDGATRLMAACTHETQLLEAAKTLQTSNARTFAYMAELQRMKAAEVMEAIMDEPGHPDETRICKGRIAISDIRIPLVWKDIYPSNNIKSKDNNKHAVFCLLSLGSEVQDTELVCVDKSTTDISFNDAIVFENATYDFKLTVEILAYPMSSSSVSAPTPQKLMSRLNRSIGKSEGKRVRENMKENTFDAVKNGPHYEKIGSLVLTLGDVIDSMRSHDLDKANHHLSLPLYESLTCRLVAQPKCVTDIALSGFINSMEMVGASPNWSYMWCEVKAGIIRGWRNPEDTNKLSPQFSIDLVPKDIKINEIEKTRQKRPHSFQIRDTTERHLFAAENKDDMVKWVRGLRQHKRDHGAWGIACMSDSDNRKPMFIASPSPRKLPSELLFDQGVRKTLVYEQLGMESPVRAMTEAIKCTDLLNDNPDSEHSVAASVQSVLLENQTTAPWAGFFTGLNTKPAKVTRKTNIHCPQDVSPQQHDYNLRSTQSSNFSSRGRFQRSRASVTNHHREVKTSQSEASGSDEATRSDVDENTRRNQRVASKKSPVSGATKKKRRAPTSPWDGSSKIGQFNDAPPPKPPLPKLPPKQKLLRNTRRASLSSGSSLDGILEEGCARGEYPVARPRLHQSNDNVFYEKATRRDELDATSSDSLRTCLSSQSSGYKSETESTCSKLSERIWVKQKNCVMPPTVLSGNQPAIAVNKFERTQSLDTEGFDRLATVKSGNSGSVLLPPSSGEAIYAEPDVCRPRTNTMPQASPSRHRPRIVSQPSQTDTEKKPTPTPRRSYLTAVESSKETNARKKLYETPFSENRESNENDPKVTHRHLSYDPCSNAYRQSKPPPLPPKLNKSKHSNVQEEPVYAQVDLTKKRSNRGSSKSADLHMKAQQAIITVCKQRMEEEENEKLSYSANKELLIDQKDILENNRCRQPNRRQDFVVWL